MTERGSASEMSEQEPSAGPAPSVSDSDMAELEGSNGKTPSESTGNKSNGDVYTAVQLIAEVQKCSHIFHTDYREYFEKEAKRNEWENICEGLFPQWSTYSAKKKRALSYKVKRKWRLIREPFFKACDRKHKAPTTSAQCTYSEIHGHTANTPAAVPSTSTQGQTDFQTTEATAPPTSALPLHHFPYPWQITDPSSYERNYQNVPPAADIPDLPLLSFAPVEMPNFTDTMIPNWFTHRNPYKLPEPITGVNRYDLYATVLTAKLGILDNDQLSAVWPNIMNLIDNASKSKPKKIKILQGELINPEAMGTRIPAKGAEIILQPEPLLEPELVAQQPEKDIQETLARPELVAHDTLEQEPEENKEERIYPRPTNAQGELIYPETDPEDLDQD